MISNIATLAQHLAAASREIRILPAGIFRSNDGRPAGLPGWKIDANIAMRIIAETSVRDDLAIDYDHQSLLTKQNGQPAPTAGWFRQLVWREGEGLFAVDVKWTDKARAMLAAGEYRYISPVFSFSSVTGQVERLFGAGLTNNPGLTGLTDLAQIAINSSQPITPPRESPHSIEAFNQVFGPAGVFHPETPPERIAELTGNVPKPKLADCLEPHQKEMMRRFYPDAFAPD